MKKLEGLCGGGERAFHCLFDPFVLYWLYIGRSLRFQSAVGAFSLACKTFPVILMQNNEYGSEIPAIFLGFVYKSMFNFC